LAYSYDRRWTGEFAGLQKEVSHRSIPALYISSPVAAQARSDCMLFDRCKDVVTLDIDRKEEEKFCTALGLWISIIQNGLSSKSGILSKRKPENRKIRRKQAQRNLGDSWFCNMLRR
jgi:hypothetical protein